MRMKGFLCSKDGSIIHIGNSMTIGRDGCNINIDDPRVASCHAVLEFNPEKCCYVIRDLNTPSGTYVNECKVQNNAVFVTHGDTIRFGQGGKPHELKLTEDLDTDIRSNSLPAQRPMSAHCLGTKSSLSPSTSVKNSLPNIHSRRSQIKPFSLPRPPTRPKSACEYDRLQDIPQDFSSNGPPAEAWSGGQSLDALVKPKLHNLLQMVDELNQSGSCYREGLLQALREQISELCQKMDENTRFEANQTFTHQLYHMERELDERRSEIRLLRQQLESTMQSSPTMTSQLAEKDKLIHELRHDLDKSKREYSMSQGLVQSLQRELTVKEAEIKRKGSELSQLQRSVRDKDIQFQSLSAKFVRVHDCRTKDEAINTVNEEMKMLKQKIRRLESRSGDHTSLINRYKNDITQLNETIKRMQSEKEAMSKVAEQQKGKYLEVQRAERLLRVDVEQARSRVSRLRSRVIKIVYSATGVKAPDHPSDVEDSKLVVDLELLLNDREKDKMEIRTLKSDAESNKKEADERESSSGMLQEIVGDILVSLAENGHHIEVLRNKRDDLSNLELEKSFLWVRKAVIDLIKSEEQWLNEIYNALRKANFNVEVAETKPGQFVLQLHQDLLDKQKQLRDLEHLFKEAEEKHKLDLLAKSEEMKGIFGVEIDKMREEERLQREKLLQDLKAQLDSDNDIKLLEASSKFDDAQRAIDDLKDEIQADKATIEELNSDIENLNGNLNRSREHETVIKEELKTILSQQSDEKKALSNEKEVEKINLEKDIEQYKEEIRQHSITIVKMEERIQDILKQLDKAQNDAESLRAELRESDAAKHRLPPTPPIIAPPPMFDINGYETTIAALRSELVGAQTQLHIQQTEILALRKDLASSEARISDMRGELSEPLKEQLENGNRLVREKELENARLRENIHKLSKIMDRQKMEIQASRQEIKEIKQAVVPHDSNIDPISRPVSATPKVQTAEASTQGSNMGKINAELTSLGAECKGERHSEIITRQREALAELRARIKALNQVQPVSPGNEELVQQVMLLKKELAEIRARQVMENDSAFREQLAFSLDEDAPVQNGDSLGHKPLDLHIERAARQQLEEALDMSERCYLDLCNNAGGLLGVPNLSGMRSANHLPEDERMRLADDRRQDLEALSQRIKSLTTRLDRKDNLLQNYDKDLARLREAEEKASEKTARVISAISRYFCFE